MAEVYLALYKGKADGIRARFEDWLIRTVTRSQYSHCEIAVRLPTYCASSYACYSASGRDGGVRMKVMALPSDKWDLIPLPPSAHSSVVCLYAQTRGCRYDWMGAVGTVFRLTQSKNRWFCSEFCATVMGITEGWRFSPGDLAAIFRREAV